MQEFLEKFSVYQHIPNTWISRPISDEYLLSQLGHLILSDPMRSLFRVSKLRHREMKQLPEVTLSSDTIIPQMSELGTLQC